MCSCHPLPAPYWSDPCIPPSDWLIIEQISDQIENFSKPMIESLYEENFAQGRLERTLNLPVTPVMDEETVRKKVCY